MRREKKTNTTLTTTITRGKIKTKIKPPNQNKKTRTHRPGRLLRCHRPRHSPRHRRRRRRSRRRRAARPPAQKQSARLIRPLKEFPTRRYLCWGRCSTGVRGRLGEVPPSLGLGRALVARGEHEPPPLFVAVGGRRFSWLFLSMFFFFFFFVDFWSVSRFPNGRRRGGGGGKERECGYFWCAALLSIPTDDAIYFLASELLMLLGRRQAAWPCSSCRCFLWLSLLVDSWCAVGIVVLQGLVSVRKNW